MSTFTASPHHSEESSLKSDYYKDGPNAHGPDWRLLQTTSNLQEGRAQPAPFYASVGNVGAIQHLEPNMTLQAPSYIVNPQFAAANYSFLVWLLDTHNQPSFFLQHYAVPVVPAELRDILSRLVQQTWPVIPYLPSIIEGPSLINCPAILLPPTFYAGNMQPYPTFQHHPSLQPSFRIRQDSSVQLVYRLQDPVVSLAHTFPLRVHGSRGFTTDFKYEILELDCVSLPVYHPFKYTWYYVPPPFVHPDVIMITDAMSPNMVLHAQLLNRWDSLINLVCPEQFTRNHIVQRVWVVWRAMHNYVLSRREQTMF